MSMTTDGAGTQDGVGMPVGAGVGTIHGCGMQAGDGTILGVGTAGAGDGTTLGAGTEVLAGVSQVAIGAGAATDFMATDGTMGFTAVTTTTLRSIEAEEGMVERVLWRVPHFVADPILTEGLEPTVGYAQTQVDLTWAGAPLREPIEVHQAQEGR